MTAAPEARPGSRWPVRHRADGDFTVSQITGASPSSVPLAGGPWPAVARAALDSRLWQPGAAVRPGAVTAAARHDRTRDPAPPGGPDDAALLRAFETAPLWNPPVADAVAGLTPAEAWAWLTLAGHWTATAAADGDLRYLNTACKLLGAVWARYGWPPRDQRDDGLADLAASVARLIDGTCGQARRRLEARLALPAAPAETGSTRMPPTRPPRGGRAPVIAVLAAAGSGTAARFTAAAAAARVPVSLLCWYEPPRPPGPESGYASAWYPPATGPAPAAPPVPGHLPQARAQSWDEVTALLGSRGADLVILAGMPVVPGRVLEAARLGFLNAHNGALPAYRGMDAVGWALLGNDPVTCTLHIARPAVDAGEIIASLPVPAAPAGTLRDRVKDAQVQLLLRAAAYTAGHGRLPDAVPQQPGAARHCYRLHPHLKRLLDTTAYAADHYTEGARP